uniref:uncharacterized protein LOC117710298 n=1 Tax=Arvicanthis niloticus TaxID=61156 RepID=UPI001486FE3D|nr:uncharacterized protein LOC117710298 [Arvicanthis niloticus]
MVTATDSQTKSCGRPQAFLAGLHLQALCQAPAPRRAWGVQWGAQAPGGAVGARTAHLAPEATSESRLAARELFSSRSRSPAPPARRPPAALPVWRGSHFSQAPAGIRQARQGARSGPATRAAGSRRPGAAPARAWARTGRLQSQAVVVVAAAAAARVAGCLVEVRGGGAAAHPPSRLGGRRAGHPWARGPPGREVAAPDAGPRSDRGRRGSHLAVGYWKKRGGERNVAERRQEKGRLRDAPRRRPKTQEEPAETSSCCKEPWQ